MKKYRIISTTNPEIFFIVQADGFLVQEDIGLITFYKSESNHDEGFPLEKLHCCPCDKVIIILE